MVTSDMYNSFPLLTAENAQNVLNKMMKPADDIPGAVAIMPEYLSAGELENDLQDLRNVNKLHPHR